MCRGAEVPKFLDPMEPDPNLEAFRNSMAKIEKDAWERGYKVGLEAGKKLMQEEMKDILVAFNAKWGQQPIEEKIKDAEFILERNEFPERKLTTFYLWRK